MDIVLIGSPWKMITIGHHRFQDVLAYMGTTCSHRDGKIATVLVSSQEAERDREIAHPLQRELTKDSAQQPDSLSFKRHRHGL